MGHNLKKDTDTIQVGHWLSPLLNIKIKIERQDTVVVSELDCKLEDLGSSLSLATLDHSHLD